MEDSNKPQLRIHYTTYPDQDSIPAGTYFKNVRTYIIKDSDAVFPAHRTAVELLNAAKDETGKAAIPGVGRCLWGMRIIPDTLEDKVYREAIYFLYNQKF